MPVQLCKFLHVKFSKNSVSRCNLYSSTACMPLFLGTIQGIPSKLQYYYHAVQHVSQAPPGRAKCPAERSDQAGSKGAARHGDRGAILAGAAVSPPGPQRIIAQMLGACGIQTDRSQHYVAPAVLQYEYVKESSLADGLQNL